MVMKLWGEDWGENAIKNKGAEIQIDDWYVSFDHIRSIIGYSDTQ